jgi:hypothetical protein
MSESALDAFERKVLRKILGSMKETIHGDTDIMSYTAI